MYRRTTLKLVVQVSWSIPSLVGSVGQISLMGLILLTIPIMSASKSVAACGLIGWPPFHICGRLCDTEFGDLLCWLLWHGDLDLCWSGRRDWKSFKKFNSSCWQSSLYTTCIRRAVCVSVWAVRPADLPFPIVGMDSGHVWVLTGFGDKMSFGPGHPLL